MKKRNPARNRQTAKNRSAINSKYLLLSALCGLILVASFFFAARQHFSSIDTSIKNSKLRKQVDELETDKRRLQLARQVALTPAEIKKAAKKFGLLEASNGDSAMVKASLPTPEPAKVTKTVASRSDDNVKLVQKTVQSSAVLPLERTRKAEKPEKRDPLVRDRKVQTQAAAGR